uniref:Translation initiation factor 1 n=1 Tax=Haymondia wallichii TaxID=157659 RepID=A0A7H0QZP4_9FABA|nr:translation initiation factor 1 [Haymondia wallichii]QNQ64643.1 translation initiation factor 1 [Haymondia wallichii]
MLIIGYVSKKIQRTFYGYTKKSISHSI